LFNVHIDGVLIDLFILGYTDILLSMIFYLIMLSTREVVWYLWGK